MKKEEWLKENEEAIHLWNEYVKKYGLPIDYFNNYKKDN